MPRRVSIPDEHVAVILPNQLADDLMTVAASVRRASLKTAARYPKDSDENRMASAQADILGDIMLAVLEAREA